MADFRISVEADYSELDRLQRKINELQTRLDNYNPSITPQVDILKTKQELNRLQNMFNETSARIGALGDAAQRQGTKISRFGSEAVSSLKNAGRAAQEAGEGFSSMAMQIGGLAARYSAIGIAMQGIYGAIGQLKQSINTIMSFQAANASLQAILGKTDEEMKSFQESAEALGRSTVFTASQVTQLQIALAKLGFVEAEIHAMEEGVLHFAQATGASLEDAASTTGAALKMFNIPASQYKEMSEKFTNAMATATMRSALDFRMIRDNLATFGPMAASMGLQIEDVLALFGKLKDNGVEASTAMTSLRNIFTKVAQGKIPGMGEVKDLDDFIKGLKALKQQGMDVGGGMKAIGPRGGTQFITLINQAEGIAKLRDDIKRGMEEDTTGGMAERMTNNLTGSLKMLQSAWEGFILTFKESDGVIKDSVDWMTKAITWVRELIAEDGDWSKETMQEIGTTIKWIIGAIASVKTLSLAKSLVNWSQNKVADMQDAVQAEILRKQGLEMAKNSGLVEANAKAVGKRTAAVQASINAMLQEIQLQRQQALEDIKINSQRQSGALQTLKIREQEIAMINYEIVLCREMMQQEIAAAAASKSASEKQLAQTNLQILAEEELKQKRKLAAAETALRGAQDAVLRENGQERYINAMERMGTGMENTATKANKLKTALNVMGFGFLVNPIGAAIAAITAFGAAVYFCATQTSEAEKTIEKMNETINQVDSEMRKNITEVNRFVMMLKQLQEGTKESLKAQQDLLAMYRKYGIALKSSLDEYGNEIVAVSELIAKHEELEAAIKAEAAARRAAEAQRIADEAHEDEVNKVVDTMGEKMEKEAVGGRGLAMAINQSLTEEDFDTLSRYQKMVYDLNEQINNYEHQLWEATKKGDKALIAELKQKYGDLKRERDAAVEDFNKLRDRLYAMTDAAGSEMGWKKNQIKQMKGYVDEFLKNMRRVVESHNEVKEAQEAAEKASNASLDTETRKAQLLRLSIKGLQDELGKLIANSNVKINIEVVTKAGIPEWMKKSLGIDKNGEGNINKARQMAALYTAAVQQADARGEDFIKIKGGGTKTRAEAIILATQYALAAQMMEQATKDRKAREEKEEKDRQKAAEAAKKAAKDRKTAEEKLADLLYNSRKEVNDRMVALTKEGYERELAEIESAYQHKKHTIEKREKDFRQTNAKARSTKVKTPGVGRGDGKWETQLGSETLTNEQKTTIKNEHYVNDRERAVKIENLNIAYARKEEDTKHETLEAEVDAKEDGYEKQKEAITLKFQKQIRDIQRKWDDEKREAEQRAEAEYLTNHSAEEWEQYKKANPSALSIDQKQTNKFQALLTAAKAARDRELNKLKRENISNLLSTGKGIGERADNLLPDELRTLTAKMQSVEEKWNGVEQALNDLLENEDDSTKREELIMAKVNASVMKSTELIELDYENLLNTSGYRMAMTDLRNVTTKELNKIIGEFERVRESAAKNLPPSELKAFNDTIKEMRKAVADKNPFKGITSGLKAVKTARKNHETAVQELNGAEVNYEQQKSMLEWLENTIKQTKDDAVRKELEIQAKAQRDAVTKAKADVEGKRKKAEGTSEKLANEKDGLSEAIKSGLENISQAFEMFASRLDGIAGEIVGGLGGLLGSLGSNWSTLQGGGFQGWLAAASITLQAIDMSIGILDSIGTRNSRAIAKDDEIADLVDAVYAYRDAVREARQEEDAWFAQTRTRSVRQALEDNADAQEKYNAKLNEQQHKYRDASSGFSQYGIPVLTALGGAALGALLAGPIGASLGAKAGAAAATAAGIAAETAAATAAAGVGAALGGTVGGATGAALGGAAGAALGTGAQYGVGQKFGPGKGDIVAAKDNLRVQTRHRTAFRSEKTKDLQSWIYDHMADDARKLGVSTELFDEDNNLNVELAEATLESDAVFAGNTRETLEELIKYQKEVNEFRDALHEYVSDLYSPMLDDMNNSLWAWYEEGKNALDAYKEYASGTFKNIAKEMTKEMMNRDIFDPLKEELNDVTEKYIKGEISDEEYARQSADIMNKSAAMYEQNLPKYQRVVEVYAENAERAGLDFEKSTTEASGTVNSAKALTEDTANELVGRVTAIQLAVENVRGTQASLLTSLQTQLATAHSDIVLGMQSQFTALTDVRAILADSYIEIRGIKENTDTLITPIKAMNTNLEELRRKMETF